MLYGAKESRAGSGGRSPHLIVAIARQKGIALLVFYVNSMKVKIMETCSQILSNHTFKKLLVDAGFQEVKGFFKMDILYKTVKKQGKALDRVGAMKFSIPPFSSDFDRI